MLFGNSMDPDFPNLNVVMFFLDNHMQPLFSVCFNIQNTSFNLEQ